ncbi:MAG: hypothetical protein ACLUI3_10460 [Christensenellales bacterium]
MVTTNHTLYAHWAFTYTVTFNANEGTVTCGRALTTEAPTGTAHADAQGCHLWAGTPNRTAHGGDGEYRGDNRGRHTLYAHWTQNIYTVTIKADKDGDVIETQQIRRAAWRKPPKSRCARVTFVGWQANGAAWDFDRTPSSARRKSSRCGKGRSAPEVAIEAASFIVGKRRKTRW